MGRSNVTLSVLVVPSVIRLLLPVPPGTEVLATTGPDTIKGRVFRSNGGLKIPVVLMVLKTPKKVTGVSG
jgi:hypothetical protein